MQTFAPGDRVVAIDLSQGPLKTLVPTHAHPFLLPDGPLRTGTVYHVAAVNRLSDGSQGVFLTGLRVLWGSEEVPWNPGRFRKVGDDRSMASVRTGCRQPATVELGPGLETAHLKLETASPAIWRNWQTIDLTKK